MASMADSGIQQIAASTKACRQIEISAVLLKLDEQSSPSQNRRSNLASVAISNANQPAVRGYIASSARWGEPISPSELSSSLPLTTILRI
jgi:hypothetical protein